MTVSLYFEYLMSTFEQTLQSARALLKEHFTISNNALD